MRIADTSTAREYLSQLLDLSGDEIITAHSGKRLLRLTPLERVLRPHDGAPLRCKLWVTDDFDLADPLNGDGV